jgi:hypothetical protein
MLQYHCEGALLVAIAHPENVDGFSWAVVALRQLLQHRMWVRKALLHHDTWH